MANPIDARTLAYYEDLTARQAKLPYSSWPQFKAEMFIDGNDFGSKPYIHRGYSGLYGEWYRCLAYMYYGYGNTSNNDRRRHGLPAIRRTK
ncbi:hypothetical protein I2483_13695 [Sporosarcina sp. E16_3]|uniref:hypothetical protein n=1 Tax=Sporosarcina sp. E16_3 TaxID=2789293 RepID=UPI001A921501|nr:hypothetical protein [Sporosarcina sp. E16_3]MBO0602716.1 hypothetical protein [Sporosarcina sp. E16_3]